MDESPTLVREVMSREVITVSADDDLGTALALMNDGRVRRLPVVEDYRGDVVVVGIISDRDVRLASRSPYLGTTEEIVAELRRLRVGDIMATEVVTIVPTAPVTLAARLMVDHRVGGLPVVLRSDGKPCLVGIITRGDLLRHLVRLVGDGAEISAEAAAEDAELFAVEP